MIAKQKQFFSNRSYFSFPSFEKRELQILGRKIHSEQNPREFSRRREQKNCCAVRPLLFFLVPLVVEAHRVSDTLLGAVHAH